MYITWFLHGPSSEYDFFCIMFTNNRKADQAKSVKALTKFNSILEQLLSLDTKKKVGKFQSMKSSSNAIEAKQTPSFWTLSCPHCKKSSHKEDKCYYKYPEQTSEGFREQLKGWIVDLKSHNQVWIRSSLGQDTETVINDCVQTYIVRTNLLTSALATRR